MQDDIFRKIEFEIASQEAALNKIRDELEVADANDVHAQSVLMQEITVRVIRLKAVEDLYKKLLGAK